MKSSRKFTYDDYRHDMPPRVFGSETEYTTDSDIQSVFHDNWMEGTYGEDLARFANPENLLAYDDDGGHKEFWLTTGGKLYFDVGTLEYATPECISPDQLVLHERAGEQIVVDFVQQMARELERPARVSKRSGFALVEKNDEVLMKEDSLGHHENYSSINLISNMKLSPGPEAISRQLNAVPEVRGFSDFLALRKLFDGMGMVGYYGYSISQKPSAINYRGFTGTLAHGNKMPFKQQSGRLEVRTGEGNKSDFVNRLKFGLTSLVIRLLEHGEYPQNLLLAYPNKAVQKISANPHADVELESGFVTKGISVLRGIVEAAVELHRKFPNAPKYELQAAEDFLTFCEDLNNVSLADGDVRALADRIDWAARFQHLQNLSATYRTLNTDNLRIVREDLLWDMLGKPDNARQQYAKFGHTALEVAMPKSPESRARVRSKLARNCSEQANCAT